MSGGKTYQIGDARELSDLLPEPAAAAVVDLAWARPHRNGVGICYPTYGPEDGLWEFVDAVYDALEDGGWAIFDADAWLLPRLSAYLMDIWGDVAASYNGGGYRRPGWVKASGGRGHYFANGGYPVVFAHKGATERTASVEASQDANGPPHHIRRDVDWESLKPIHPYEVWLDAVTEPGELVAIPCAGTAPAALALERLYGGDARYVCVDSEPDAKAAFEHRRRLQLGPEGQQTLPEVDA